MAQITAEMVREFRAWTRANRNARNAPRFAPYAERVEQEPTWTPEEIAATRALHALDASGTCVECARREREDDPDWGCGTNAGYRRHRRKDETACAPCMTAHREYGRRNIRHRKRSS